MMGIPQDATPPLAPHSDAPGMRLILVRHGQTTCNVGLLWHGWDDCSLTELGLAQARTVGRRLAAEHIDAVVSSDARRAVQTAEAIAAPHHLAVTTHAGLRERHIGEYAGLTTESVHALAPTLEEDRRRDFWAWRPPGGETLREVQDRAVAVIERLAAEHAGQTVAVVAHMGTVRVLLCAYAGLDLERSFDMPFGSTSLSILQVGGANPRVEVLSDASHAEGLSALG